MARALEGTFEVAVCAGRLLGISPVAGDLLPPPVPRRARWLMSSMRPRLHYDPASSGPRDPASAERAQGPTPRVPETRRAPFRLQHLPTTKTDD